MAVAAKLFAQTIIQPLIVPQLPHGPFIAKHQHGHFTVNITRWHLVFLLKGMRIRKSGKGCASARVCLVSCEPMRQWLPGLNDAQMQSLHVNVQ
jgi:hypothetical protein